MTVDIRPYQFSVKTLGCKVNQYESESLISAIENKGLIFVPPGEHVDLFIINTCTVTGKAAMQSRQAIRQAIRRHPGALIVATGCYAQVAPDEIKTIRGVHHIIGQSDKHRLFDIIAPYLTPALSFNQRESRLTWHDFGEKTPISNFRNPCPWRQDPTLFKNSGRMQRVLCLLYCSLHTGQEPKPSDEGGFGKHPSDS